MALCCNYMSSLCKSCYKMHVKTRQEHRSCGPTAIVLEMRKLRNKQACMWLAPNQKVSCRKSNNLISNWDAILFQKFIHVVINYV